MAWLARPAPALWPRGLLGRAVRGKTTELSTVKPQQSCRRPHPLSRDSNRFATAEALWLTGFGKSGFGSKVAQAALPQSALAIHEKSHAPRTAMRRRARPRWRQTVQHLR